MSTTQGICLLAPPEGGDQPNTITTQQQEWISELQSLAAQSGLQVEIYRTVLRRSSKPGEEKRILYVLDPWEADRLYKSIHRGFDAVFQAGSAYAIRNINREIGSNNLINIKRLVSHKVFFSAFDGVPNAADSYAEWVVWLQSMHCKSHRDPRVIPTHMFSPESDWNTLSSDEEQDRFKKMHGGPTKLMDSKERHWQQTHAWHGNDSLTVGRFALPEGFHWDVKAARTTTRIHSLTSIWRFDENSYLNISPDGYIRSGQSLGTTAVMEDQAPRPAPLEQVVPVEGGKISKKDRLRARRARSLARKHR